MFAIRLEKKMEEDLDLLAKRRGTTRSALVREALARYLEDNEDLELAREAKERMSGRKPLDQLRQELGL
jgi:RHH-type rel operon transcriptional repressor/antitoxin RelB